MRFKSYLTILLILCCFCSNAQKTTDHIYNIITEIIEQSTAQNPNSIEFTTVFERLINYNEHPLNINTTTRLEFESLYFLSEHEIDLILEYRNKLGSFVELQELLFAGLSPETFHYLSFFTTTKPLLLTNKTHFKDGRHEIYSRWYRVIEQQKGYEKETNGFLGDPNKLYFRYKYNLSNNIQAGVTLEKDAGERFYHSVTQNKYNSIEYLNAHLFLKQSGIIKTIALGAYSLNLGQGLLAWNGFSLGKSSLLNLSKKSSREISPYSSANETNFLRGFATQLSIKKLIITPYISYKKIDSRLKKDSSSLFSSSFPRTGLHRTISELATKGKNKELISGLSVNKHLGRLKIRSNYQFLNYKYPKVKGSQLYQSYDFDGYNLHSLSVDYKFKLKKLSLFGEHSFQSKKEQAHLTSIRLTPSNNLILNILYRSYSSGYFTAYNNGFGENSNTKNEAGLYLSAEYNLSKKTNLKVFIDTYKRKAPSFESINAYSGEDLFIQITNSQNSFISHYLRLQYEQNDASTDLNQTQHNSIIKARYHLDIEPRYNLRLRTRIETNLLNKSSFGTLFYQDIKYIIPKTKLTLNFRYARFDSPNFSQAIYAYENDVLYFFNTPAYINKGTRFYTLISLPVNKHFKIWLKVSQWHIQNQSTISSGNTEISGNKKTDIHFQTQLTF